MKLRQCEQKELKDIKKRLKEKLENCEKFKKLQLQKEEIINYLILMGNTKENKELIKKFNELDSKLKDLEQQVAYIITKDEKNKEIQKKSLLGKLKVVNRLSEEEYNAKFNTLLKDTNYLNILKQRSEVFQELSKINKEDKSVVYRLDSIETEISTIETDTLREFLSENY